MRQAVHEGWRVVLQSAHRQGAEDGGEGGGERLRHRTNQTLREVRDQAVVVLQAEEEGREVFL